MIWSETLSARQSLKLKQTLYKIIFCNGQNRDGRRKKEGWFICWGLLHFTSDRKISVLRGTEALLSRGELGGRRRCPPLWQAPRKPGPTSAQQLGRRPCRPQIVASCHSEMVQRGVSWAVFWPKFNRITNQLLHSVPEAGNHHQLAGGVWSR